MTKEDVVNNLGTIAQPHASKEWTQAREFKESESVIVRTKHNDDEQSVWESSACGILTVHSDDDYKDLIH